MEDYKKKYEDALERAKSAIKECGNNVGRIKMIESIFPELKESEDEQHRKWILEYLYDGLRKSDEQFKDQFKSAIAWFEKQGEQSNNEDVEKEKNDYVSGQFLYCKGSFNEFKEGESYWLEYVGNDNYIGRSDNILNQKFHITPRQLYTWLDPRHAYNCNETNAPTEQGEKDSSVKPPTFTFDDVLALQCCMETVKKVQEDKDLYEKLKDIHGRVYDAYQLEKQGKPEDMGEVSDGYHTFNELYYYRMLYNAAFFNRLPKDWVHKSKRHHDGEECFGGGWFIVMANLPTGQISNHYELKDWDLFQIPEKDIADEWDGHTPQEAAERLHKFLLEKQGEQKSIDPDTLIQQRVDALADIVTEQKPADKIEPKFKVGDWVVCEITGSVCQIKNCIENLSNHKYGYDLTNGGYIGSDEVNHYHLWTIQDVKKGDILARNDEIRSICIFSRFDGINKRDETFLCRCGLEGEGLGQQLSINGYHTDSKGYVPATREQRELLFREMEEAGYKWDDEKKELTHKEVTKKSDKVWNEDDENFFGMLEGYLEFDYDLSMNDKANTLDWLKSIKERLQ